MTETPLNVNDRFVSLSPATGSSSLAYDFELRSAADLLVVLVRAGVETTLELTTHYSFPTGVGDHSGGTIALVSNSQENDTYLLIGLEKIERLSDFTGGQKFSAQKFNADLDALVRIGQETRRDIGRAVKTGYGQTGPTIDTASFADGDVLMWSGGNFAKGPDAGDIEAAQGYAAAAAQAKTDTEGLKADVVGLKSDTQGIADAALAAGALQIGYAGEWAIRAEDDPIPIAAGGDGATDFSAMHWALKAQEAAGSVDTPTIGGGDANKLIHVNAAANGYELRTAAASRTALGLSYADATARATFRNNIGAQVEPGFCMAFAANSPPTGWLKANGAAISRTTYASLFAAIGTTFGVGDGSTTFNVPDLRGEFIRGWDDSRGVDSGRVFGSAQTDQMQGHFHTRQYANTVDVNTSAGSLAGGSSIGTTANRDNVGAPSTDGANGTPRTGSETRPRNVAMLACIKY